MKRTLAIALITLGTISASASEVDSERMVKLPEGYVACKGSEEFEKSVAYFRNNKVLNLNDRQVVTWSLKISKGCSGALSRFQRVFELLTESGVDLQKSVEMAASFSEKSNEQTTSFVGLFKTFFLDNYFDLDFMTAFEVSVKISEHPSRASVGQKDFERLYKFCTNHDKLGLPIRDCGKYSLGLLKHFELYPDGLFPSFEKIFDFITVKSGASLNIKEALEMTDEILAYGPLAYDNFKKAYEFSLSKKGLQTSIKQAMRIALEVSKSSMTEKEKTQ